MGNKGRYCTGLYPHIPYHPKTLNPTSKPNPKTASPSLPGYDAQGGWLSSEETCATWQVVPGSSGEMYTFGVIASGLGARGLFSPPCGDSARFNMLQRPVFLDEATWSSSDE